MKSLPDRRLVGFVIFNASLNDDEPSSSSSSSSSSQLERSTSKRKVTAKGYRSHFCNQDCNGCCEDDCRVSCGKDSNWFTLLSTNDPRIQENAVTALLNLSIFDNNKVLIMAAGAIDSIIQVLQSGKTMKARENAAAAIFSLSMIDDCKVAIGAKPRAIPALVGLLKDGTTIGKRDAATALFNLAVYNANKASVVIAGAVPLLIQLLVDDKAGITDDALAVLALLSGCAEGLEEIRANRVVVPLLVDLLRLGSPKGKENSVTLLLGLCKREGGEVARRLLIYPHSIPSLQSLVSGGSLKAKRKADSLLRLLNRYCSQSPQKEV